MLTWTRPFTHLVFASVLAACARAQPPVANAGSLRSNAAESRCASERGCPVETRRDYRSRPAPNAASSDRRGLCEPGNVEGCRAPDPAHELRTPDPSHYHFTAARVRPGEFNTERCWVDRDRSELELWCRGRSRTWPLSHPRAAALDRRIQAIGWAQLDPSLARPAGALELVYSIYDGPVYRAAGRSADLPPSIRGLADYVLDILVEELAREETIAAMCLPGQRYQSPCPDSDVRHCPGETCAPARAVGESCTAPIHCSSGLCENGRCGRVTDRCPGLHELSASAPNAFNRCAVDSDCGVLSLPMCGCSAYHVARREFVHCQDRFAPPPCVRRLDPPRCAPEPTPVCRRGVCVAGP